MPLLKTKTFVYKTKTFVKNEKKRGTNPLFLTYKVERKRDYEISFFQLKLLHYPHKIIMIGMKFNQLYIPNMYIAKLKKNVDGEKKEKIFQNFKKQIEEKIGRNLEINMEIKRWNELFQTEHYLLNKKDFGACELLSDTGVLYQLPWSFWSISSIKIENNTLTIKEEHRTKKFIILERDIIEIIEKQNKQDDIMNFMLYEAETLTEKIRFYEYVKYDINHSIISGNKAYFKKINPTFDAVDETEESFCLFWNLSDFLSKDWKMKVWFLLRKSWKEWKMLDGYFIPLCKIKNKVWVLRITTTKISSYKTSLLCLDTEGIVLSEKIISRALVSDLIPKICFLKIKKWFIILSMNENKINDCKSFYVQNDEIKELFKPKNAFFVFLLNWKLHILCWEWKTRTYVFNMKEKKWIRCRENIGIHNKKQSFFVDLTPDRFLCFNGYPYFSKKLDISYSLGFNLKYNGTNHHFNYDGDFNNYDADWYIFWNPLPYPILLSNEGDKDNYIVLVEWLKQERYLTNAKWKHLFQTIF